MMSKKAIKIICIIMAALMLLSVVTAALQVFAVDEAYYETYVNPATGDSDSDYLVPAGIAVAAILAVVICVVLPKIKNKDADDDDDEEEYDDEKDDDEIPEKPSKSEAEEIDNGKPHIIKKSDKNEK
ncbi:MAG: hypothetical protein IKY78_05930 [Clostridia bacterium]|nr:hypothetical protein [Clostridia bacterium]